jgi:hypothetical protein
LCFPSCIDGIEVGITVFVGGTEGDFTVFFLGGDNTEEGKDDC